MNDVATEAPPIPAALPSGRAKRRSLRWFGLIVGLLAAYKVLPLYYYYFDLKVRCAHAIQDAEIESDEEIRRKLLVVIDQYGIPATIRDIQIRREGGRIRISVPYEEKFQVSILGNSVTLFSFSFSPSAERVYR